MLVTLVKARKDRLKKLSKTIKTTLLFTYLLPTPQRSLRDCEPFPWLPYARHPQLFLRKFLWLGLCRWR